MLNALLLVGLLGAGAVFAWLHAPLFVQQRTLIVGWGVLAVIRRCRYSSWSCASSVPAVAYGRSRVSAGPPPGQARAVAFRQAADTGGSVLEWELVIAPGSPGIQDRRWTGAGHHLRLPGLRAGPAQSGLISAGFLDPLKARLLLHVLLSGGAAHEEIAGAFQAAGGYGQPRLSRRRKDGGRRCIAAS